MKELIGNTMYLTDQDIFYFCAGDKMYRIRSDAKSQEELFDGMNNIRASQKRQICRLDGEPSKGREGGCHAYDGSEYGDGCGKYRRSREPITAIAGFVEDDCVYGISTKKDLKKSDTIARVPMSEIHIISTEEGHELQKSVRKKNLLFTDASVSQEGTITLTACRYKDGALVEDQPVSVTNNEIIARERITADMITDEVFRRQMVLELPSPVPAFAVNLIIPDIGYDMKNRESLLDESLFAKWSYIYAKGGWKQQSIVSRPRSGQRMRMPALWWIRSRT